MYASMTAFNTVKKDKGQAAQQLLRHSVLPLSQSLLPRYGIKAQTTNTKQRKRDQREKDFQQQYRITVAHYPNYSHADTCDQIT